MHIKKGIGKGKTIPLDDFGMWISDILLRRKHKGILPQTPFIPKRRLPNKRAKIKRIVHKNLEEYHD